MSLYIKPTFLLTQAAEGASHNQDKEISSYMHSILNELCLGNYDLAMRLLNKSLDQDPDKSEYVALLELKNILASLRLRSSELPQLVYGPTKNSTALPHSFTLEMLEVVQKVLHCRSHYEVLRISHHATFSEVKRAYKRLALRLHPDKNRAPGAEQAFRRINEAADTLTDNQKRIEYNLLLGTGDFIGPYVNSVEVSYPEEPYNNDMDMDLPPRRTYQPANQRVPQHQTLYQTEQLVIGLVASVVFIIITLRYMATAPNYSFTPTSTHSVRLTSSINHVPYFVTPEFAASRTAKELEAMELEIEELYLMDLKHNCKQERKMRDKLLQRARNGNNRNLWDHALRMPTPACHALVKLDHAKYQHLIVDNESAKSELWK